MVARPSVLLQHEFEVHRLRKLRRPNRTSVHPVHLTEEISRSLVENRAICFHPARLHFAAVSQEVCHLSGALRHLFMLFFICPSNRLKYSGETCHSPSFLCGKIGS